jgi:hypothetical protein
MTKVELLDLLGANENLCADRVADLLSVERPAASMALLRLARQGLAGRWVDVSDGRVRYAISERGLARLDYLSGQGMTHGANTIAHAKGGSHGMKRAKTHSGKFYCPNCVAEYEVTNETSLKCPECGGPLAAGTIEDMWDDDQE